jgi:predicted kinase
MASVAILVNGLPAAGKTTLATTLGPLLDCPVLTKDPVKELFADMLGPQADSRRLGGITMDALWRLAAETGGGVVIESTFDREHTRRGLEVAGSPRTVELWCDVPLELARERFLARTPDRHAIHGEWVDDAAPREPLGDYPLIRVDTSKPVDLDDLMVRLGAAFL